MRLRATVLGLIAASSLACGSRPNDGDPIHAEPSRLDFGSVPVGRTRTLSLLLVNDTETAHIVDRFEADPALRGIFEPLSPPSALGVGDNPDIRVEFRPSRAGRWLGDLRVELAADSRLPPVVIPVTGAGVVGDLVSRPTEIDFGRVRVGSSRTATVVAKNLGPAPVEARALTFDVGSSEAFRARLPFARVFAPGEEEAIPVRFSPQEAGSAQAVARMSTDGREVSAFELRMFGEGVTSDLSIEPGEGVRFGGVWLGETRRRAVRVRNLGAASIPRVDLRLQGEVEGLRVTPDVLIDLSPGAERDIELVFAPTLAGARVAVLAASAASDEGEDRAEIPVQAEAWLPIGAEPSLPGPPLDFGRVSLGHTPTRSVWLFVQGMSGLGGDVIAEAQPAGGGFELRSAAAPTVPGARRRLEVELTATAVGPVAGLLRVGTATRALVAQVVTAPTPGLEVWPPGLHFGPVPRGEIARRRLRLRSIGTTDVDAIEVQVEPPFRLTEEAPRRIPPGAAVELGVEFEDGSTPEGRFDGRVTVRAAGLATAVIPVSASVVPTSRGVADVEVSLRWSAEANLDLHLARAEDLAFSVPGDVCFCNPHPDWGEAGEPRDDPYLLADGLRGPGEERIRLLAAFESAYRVEVVHGGGGDTDAEVEVWVRGRRVAREVRRLGPSTRWTVGRLGLEGLSAVFRVEDLPLTPEVRAWCD